MSKIGLVSCAKRKLSYPAPASDLYSSVPFKKARRYVEKHCDRWFILSAKHGLLHPDDVIEPYDVTLNTMPAANRRQWAQRVLPEIYTTTNAGDVLVFLAGEKYREYLIPEIEKRGYRIEVPMQGLRSGKQLQWLDKNL
ncbi:MAG: hypothetical protein L0154_25010 [Chloroflexi bacterium]|nr:hypothetical protein [Chloroflexota bacterium]